MHVLLLLRLLLWLCLFFLMQCLLALRQFGKGILLLGLLHFSLSLVCLLLLLLDALFSLILLFCSLSILNHLALVGLEFLIHPLGPLLLEHSLPLLVEGFLYFILATLF